MPTRDAAQLRRARSAEVAGRVRLHSRPHPAEPEAIGAAYGDNIYLNVAMHRLSADEWMHVLGHELAHVRQQREGRVLAQGQRADVAYNDDAGLEAEAEAFAREFASGAPLVAAGSMARVERPVLQCLIELQGRPIHSSRHLSEKAQAVLEMIPSGSIWLDSVSAGKLRYTFQDEVELLSAIQTGLHGGPQILLRRNALMAHPCGLYRLTENELHNLWQAELSDAPNPIHKTLVTKARYDKHLWTDQDLAIGDTLLSETGVADEPIFTVKTLQDRLALFEHVNSKITENETDLELQKEASKFAVGLAQTALEYVDYVDFYIALADDPGTHTSVAAKRLRYAETIADCLFEPLLNTLWCPTFQPAPNAAELSAQIGEWSAKSGQWVGFPRLSASLVHMVKHADLQGATGNAAKKIIENHMDHLQTCWMQYTPRPPQCSQDGSYRSYLYELPGLRAELRLSDEGSLTVGPCVPYPPPLTPRVPVGAAAGTRSSGTVTTRGAPAPPGTASSATGGSTPAAGPGTVPALAGNVAVTKGSSAKSRSSAAAPAQPSGESA